VGRPIGFMANDPTAQGEPERCNAILIKVSPEDLHMYPNLELWDRPNAPKFHPDIPYLIVQATATIPHKGEIFLEYDSSQSGKYWGNDMMLRYIYNPISNFEQRITRITKIVDADGPVDLDKRTYQGHVFGLPESMFVGANPSYTLRQLTVAGKLNLVVAFDAAHPETKRFAEAVKAALDEDGYLELDLLANVCSASQVASALESGSSDEESLVEPVVIPKSKSQKRGRTPARGTSVPKRKSKRTKSTGAGRGDRSWQPKRRTGGPSKYFVLYERIENAKVEGAYITCGDCVCVDTEPPIIVIVVKVGEHLRGVTAKHPESRTCLSVICTPLDGADSPPRQLFMIPLCDLDKSTIEHGLAAGLFVTEALAPTSITQYMKSLTGTYPKKELRLRGLRSGGEKTSLQDSGSGSAEVTRLEKQLAKSTAETQQLRLAAAEAVRPKPGADTATLVAGLQKAIADLGRSSSTSATSTNQVTVLDQRLTAATVDAKELRRAAETASALESTRWLSREAELEAKVASLQADAKTARSEEKTLQASLLAAAEARATQAIASGLAREVRQADQFTQHTFIQERSQASMLRLTGHGRSDSNRDQYASQQERPQHLSRQQAFLYRDQYALPHAQRQHPQPRIGYYQEDSFDRQRAFEDRGHDQQGYPGYSDPLRLGYQEADRGRPPALRDNDDSQGRRNRMASMPDQGYPPRREERRNQPEARSDPRLIPPPFRLTGGSLSLYQGSFEDNAFASSSEPWNEEDNDSGQSNVGHAYYD
jgi:hypothetical protein